MLYILFERKKLIVCIFIPVFLLCAILAVVLPSSYRSYAKFSLIFPQQLDPLQQEKTWDYKNIARRSLQEQKELIFSIPLLQRVVEETYPGIDSKDIDKRIEQIREHVDVTPPAGQSFEDTSVFYVSYTGHNPTLVFETVKRIANTYVQVFDEFSKVRTAYSLDFYKEQADRLHADMAEKEKNLRDYETQQALALMEIISMGGEQAATEVGPSVLLTQFKRKYHDLQEELAGLNIAIDSLEAEAKKGTAIPAVPTEMDQAGRTIAVYKNKLAQLQIQMNEMKSQFTDGFAPLKQVEKELKLNVNSLKEELGRTIEAQKMNARTIEAKLEELDRIINSLQERIRFTANERSVYEHMRQEYRLAKDAYTYIFNQMEQAQMANALHNSKQYLTRMEDPVMPTVPFKPDRPAIIILGFFAGLFFSLATAVTVDYFDRTIKKPIDVERTMDVLVLGSVPKVG